MVLHHLGSRRGRSPGPRDGSRRTPRGRRQRPRAQPARLDRRLADGTPADRQSLHPARRAAVRPPLLSGGRDGRAAARRRDDPGQDRSRRDRPALRDRGALDARGRPIGWTIRTPRPTRSGPADDRTAGRGDRRRRAGRGGAGGPPGRGRPAGRRPRTVGPLALAGRRRLRVAGGDVCPPADRPGCRAAARSRPADPGDARRDTRRRDLPADLRRGRRGRTGGRLRPVPAGPVPARAGDAGRRRDPTRMVGHRGRSRRRVAHRPTARRVAGDPRRRGHRRRRRAAFGRRAGRRRRPPGPPRATDRADLPPAGSGTGRGRGRPDAAPRTTATSGSRRSPAAGSTSGSCSVARGARRSSATAPGPSPTRSSPRSRRPPRTRRAGATCRRRTSSPVPGRSVTA